MTGNPEVMVSSDDGRLPRRVPNMRVIGAAPILSKSSGISIALQLGYSDQTALTRAMRRMTEMTPAAYRRLHRQ